MRSDLDFCGSTSLRKEMICGRHISNIYSRVDFGQHAVPAELHVGLQLRLVLLEINSEDSTSRVVLSEVN